MNEKIIKFNQVKEYNNGAKFEFSFEGTITNQNLDLEKINKLLTAFIYEQNHKDMSRNVSTLRTILKDIEENLLYVKYSDINNQEIVKYSNGDLCFFE